MAKKAGLGSIRSAAAYVCPAQGEQGMFRSEARDVMQRWRALTLREQIQVIEFLKAL